MDEARDSVVSLEITDHEILSGSADCRVRRYDIRNGQLQVDYMGSKSNVYFETKKKSHTKHIHTLSLPLSLSLSLSFSLSIYLSISFSLSADTNKSTSEQRQFYIKTRPGQKSMSIRCRFVFVLFTGLWLPMTGVFSVSGYYGRRV